MKFDLNWLEGKVEPLARMGGQFTEEEIKRGSEWR